MEAFHHMKMTAQLQLAEARRLEQEVILEVERTTMETLKLELQVNHCQFLFLFTRFGCGFVFNCLACRLVQGRLRTHEISRCLPAPDHSSRNNGDSDLIIHLLAQEATRTEPSRVASACIN